MKKKILSLVLAGAVLSVGSIAFAQGNGQGEGTFNFGQMKQHMQQMHSDMSVQELQEMYRACHGTLGAEPSNNFKKK
ncbi:hypothetical protein GGQ84_000208 [Desulfitispora alkaliphila]|uniref:hypothetical protein n=1 Tax=Desulfitispora alkaliphila TaxID=622674 RepID=UPI003D2142C9